jgi:peptidoglycan/LPS O-acetylase OafA/YrhL
VEHRSDIEGLRAIAVIAVLLFHFGVPGTDGGYVGVDVFFVISGFLITALLLREKEATGTISLKDFYARRIRRLLPVSFAVVVITAVAGIVWLSPARLDDFAQEIVAAALFFPNMLFASRGANYLQSQLQPSPLQHFWSLAVEEQFYAIWPVLMVLVTRGRTLVRQRVFLLVSAIVIGSFALSVAFTTTQPSWSYFGLHTRAWELGIGALLAVLWPFFAARTGVMRPWIGWMGAALIVFSVLTFNGATAFPGYLALLPVLGTALIIASGRAQSEVAMHPASLHRMLAMRPLQYIGARSYALYVWHWPPLIIVEASRGDSLSVMDRIWILAAVLAATEITHRVLENPIRRSQFLVQRTQLTLNIGAFVILGGVLAGAAAAYIQPSQSTGVVVSTPTLATSTTAAAIATSTTVAAPSSPELISMTQEDAPQPVIDGLSISVAPDNLDPPTNKAETNTNITYDNDCHQFFKETIKKDCIFGDPTGETTIALYGDSHAAQWFSPLNEIAIANKWRLIALTQGGCTPIELSIYNVQNGGVYRHCTPWRVNALQYMKDEGVDFVFTGQYVRYRDANTGGIVSSRQWRLGYTELVQTLRAAAMEPIFFGDTPDIPGVPPECIASNRRNVSQCVATLNRSTLVDVMDALRKVARDEKVSLIDPQRWLCHNNLCPVIVGNISVYRDDNHISDVMARWLQPLLADKIVPFINQFATVSPVAQE